MNNYPIDLAHKRVAAGTYPAQHLWGMWELRDKYIWSYSTSSLAKLTRNNRRIRAWTIRVMPLIGDPLQTAKLLTRLRSIDIIYACDQQSATGALLLKKLRLIRKPVVVVLHNGPRLHWTWYQLRSANAVITLSPGTHTQSLTRLPQVYAEQLTWGPSLDSPVYDNALKSNKAMDFVAAGKSNRDYDDLRAVAIEQKLSGVILTGATRETYDRGRVEIENAGPTGYADVLELMREARWCVVPVADPSRLSGLTEAADALASGTRVLANSRQALPYPEGAVEFYGSRTELAQKLNDTSIDSTVDSEYLSSVSMQSFAAHLDEIFRSVS